MNHLLMMKLKIGLKLSKAEFKLVKMDISQ